MGSFSFDIFQYLRQVPFLKALKDSSVQELARHAQARVEKKGTVLFPPETISDKFYFVVSGWVKLFRETMDGEEAVIDVLTDGNIFGEIGLSGTETVPYGAEVVEDAHIIALPRFLLAEEIMRNSAFGLSMIQSMTRQKLQRDMEIEHRTVQTAPQRIGCFLLKFCTKETTPGKTLHLPYDKTLIASRLGMQPETFSRTLSRLRDETDLKIKGSTVEIPSIKKLAEYTCSACSSHFPCKDA